MRLFVAVASAFIAVAVAGCKDPSRVTGPRNATLTIEANVAATTIAALALEVTGPGIAEPLMKNLTLDGSTATASIEVPAGTDRHFVLRGYDAAGILTHRGETTATLHSGETRSLALTLSALTSNPTVTATVGGVTVTLTPGATTLAVGASTAYSATASENGTAVVNPQITWASSVPTIASVSATGTVTAHVPGTAKIVATFRGAAASATLTVQE
jgi:hypothetical protein